MLSARRKAFDKMMDIYYAIKEEIKQRDKYLYERWKAGGFLIDPHVVSTYPDLEKVIEDIEYNEATEQLEDEEYE